MTTLDSRIDKLPDHICQRVCRIAIKQIHILAPDIRFLDLGWLASAAIQGSWLPTPATLPSRRMFVLGAE